MTSTLNEHQTQLINDIKKYFDDNIESLLPAKILETAHGNYTYIKDLTFTSTDNIDLTVKFSPQIPAYPTRKKKFQSRKIDFKNKTLFAWASYGLTITASGDKILEILNTREAVFNYVVSIEKTFPLEVNKVELINQYSKDPYLLHFKALFNNQIEITLILTAENYQINYNQNVYLTDLRQQQIVKIIFDERSLAQLEKYNIDLSMLEFQYYQSFYSTTKNKITQLFKKTSEYRIMFDKFNYELSSYRIISDDVSFNQTGDDETVYGDDEEEEDDDVEDTDVFLPDAADVSDHPTEHIHSTFSNMFDLNKMQPGINFNKQLTEDNTKKPSTYRLVQQTAEGFIYDTNIKFTDQMVYKTYLTNSLKSMYSLVGYLLDDVIFINNLIDEHLEKLLKKFSKD